MTTARERYEAKTKVVTFRVNHELYEELEEIRKQANLSFADLIKLGAGIARETVDEKLSEIDELDDKLTELKETIRQEQEKLDTFMVTAKKERLTELEQLYQIYTLFDAGYGTDEVRFKLKLGKDEAFRQFKEWSRLRGEQEKLRIELLKKCLHNYIFSIQENMLYRYSWRESEEAQQRLKHYQSMLSDPSRLTDDEKAFLIDNYSYFL